MCDIKEINKISCIITQLSMGFNTNFVAGIPEFRSGSSTFGFVRLINLGHTARRRQNQSYLDSGNRN